MRRKLRDRTIRSRLGDDRPGGEVHHGHRVGEGVGEADQAGARTQGVGRRHRGRPGRHGGGGTAAQEGLPGPHLRPLRPHRRAAGIRHSEFQAREARRGAAQPATQGQRRDLPHGFRGRPRSHALRPAQAALRGAHRHRRVPCARASCPGFGPRRDRPGARIPDRQQPQGTGR